LLEKSRLLSRKFETAGLGYALTALPEKTFAARNLVKKPTINILLDSKTNAIIDMRILRQTAARRPSAHSSAMKHGFVRVAASLALAAELAVDCSFFSS
jgi:hypothetical protein